MRGEKTVDTKTNTDCHHKKGILRQEEINFTFEVKRRHRSEGQETIRLYRRKSDKNRCENRDFLDGMAWDRYGSRIRLRQ
jgi:hypothetical protein